MKIFVICAKLKQHTPLIHFQPYETGAVLRASEVKPKLDKFIIEKIGQGNYEQIKSEVLSLHKDWFINKEDIYALNYKVCIEPVSCVQINDVDKYFMQQNGRFLRAPMYFGNMVSRENAEKKVMKKFSFCSELKLKIVVYNEELKEKIDEYIDEFFMTTNFGTRQSKGYGSFSIKRDKPKNIYLKYPYFTVRGGEIKLFEKMDVFYKAIRSGINDYSYNGVYMKSLMFAYAKSKNEQWEKKTIKSVFYNLFSKTPGFANRVIHTEEKKYHEKNSQSSNLDTTPQYIFKDCLGLSKNEQWKIPYMDGGKILKYGGFFKLEKNSDRIGGQEEIERMKSPITLKPVQTSKDEYRVYVIYHEIPTGFLNEKFHIRVQKYDEELELKIYPMFSVHEYIRFICTCDVERYILKGKDTIKAKEIKRIFSELKEQFLKLEQ